MLFQTTPLPPPTDNMHPPERPVSPFPVIAAPTRSPPLRPGETAQMRKPRYSLKQGRISNTSAWDSQHRSRSRELFIRYTLPELYHRFYLEQLWPHSPGPLQWCPPLAGKKIHGDVVDIPGISPAERAKAELGIRWFGRLKKKIVEVLSSSEL